MEIATSAEKLAQDWKLKIRDWNLHAALPANTEIADGKVVLPRNNQGFHDHGTNFGVLGEQKFRMAITDVKKVHKDANLLAVFPTENGDVVWYEFKHEMKGVDAQGRGGVYSASAYFLFNSGEGQKFVNQVQEEPSLTDALVASKFPIFKQEVKVQDWNEILYLPQDLFFKTMEEQIKVIKKPDIVITINDLEQTSSSDLASEARSHVQNGSFRIVEKMQFSVNKVENKLRFQQLDKVSLNQDEVMRRGVRYFLEQLDIPYEKRASVAAFQQPNPNLSPGACYVLIDERPNGSIEIAFAGLTSHTTVGEGGRTSETIFRLSLDGSDVSNKIVDVIKRGNLSEELLPVLHSCFMVDKQQSEGQTNLFKHFGKKYNLTTDEINPFIIPAKHIVIGKKEVGEVKYKKVFQK